MNILVSPLPTCVSLSVGNFPGVGQRVDPVRVFYGHCHSAFQEGHLTYPLQRGGLQKACRQSSCLDKVQFGALSDSRESKQKMTLMKNFCGDMKLDFGC